MLKDEAQATRAAWREKSRIESSLIKNINPTTSFPFAIKKFTPGETESESGSA